MDVERLSKSPIGHLTPIAGTDPLNGREFSHFAYVPAPLPAEIELTSATWKLVVAAEAALGRLDQAAQQFPQPALLRQPSLRREAQSTSALEGTYAPIETVFASDPGDSKQSMELREVFNYVAAAEEGFHWISERPITESLIGGLQKTLVTGTPGERYDAGRVRQRQVFVGSLGRPIEQSRYVPPPPGDQLQAGLEDWVAWVRSPPADLPAVVCAALAHYQFETLHPFFDGNGRIGRLLIAMSLTRAGILREPILVVSPWFEDRRDAYQDRLLDLSCNGDWSSWVRFFAEGVATSADTTRRRVELLLEWREQVLHQVRDANVIGVAERVAGELIGSPFVRASTVAQAHGVTHAGAMLALRRLADLGVLRERKSGGRVSFVADRALELLQI